MGAPHALTTTPLAAMDDLGIELNPVLSIIHTYEFVAKVALTYMLSIMWGGWFYNDLVPWLMYSISSDGVAFPVAEHEDVWLRLGGNLIVTTACAVVLWLIFVVKRVWRGVCAGRRGMRVAPNPRPADDGSKMAWRAFYSV